MSSHGPRRTVKLQTAAPSPSPLACCHRDGSDNVAALVHALMAVNDRLCEIRRFARLAGSTGSSAAASGHSDAGEPAVMAVNAVLRI
jgi:hypothetical protein